MHDTIHDVKCAFEAYNDTMMFTLNELHNGIHTMIIIVKEIIMLKQSFIGFIYTGEDNEEDEEDERKEQDAARRRKPWGDTSYFCPVALKDQNVLWPGQQENAIRYREKLYYFSTEEAKEKFRANPLEYIAVDRPLEV